MRRAIVALGDVVLRSRRADRRTTRARQWRFHVFTEPNPGGFVDPDLKQREDSIKDMVKSLSKKEDLAGCRAANGGGCRVEILGRGREETGAELTFGAETSKEKKAALRARLVVGEYSTELVAQSDGRILGQWGEVAGKLAKQIEKWVDTNYAKIIERRGKKSQE